MPSVSPLSHEVLARRCDPNAFQFETTADLAPLREALGQGRAIEATRLAVGLRRRGYNLIVVGPPGSGKHRIISDMLQELAQEMPPGDDCCYVYDFAEPRRPRPLRLPSGRGKELVADMTRLVDELKASLPAALEGDEYHSRSQQIREELTDRAEGVFARVAEQAKRVGIKMLRGPAGIAFLPTADGQVLTPEAFKNLPEEQREETTRRIEHLQEQIQTHLREVPRWAKEARQKMYDLKREVSRLAVGNSIEDLKERYRDLPHVLSYLEAVAEDVVDRNDAFDDNDEAPDKALELLGGPDPFKRYEVNLLVDNSDARGAPVVYEDNPTIEQLLGRVGHRVHLGNLVSDFTLIRSGALHRANGGFLILDAHKLLSHQQSWQALKRALFAEEVRIESLGQLLGYSGPVSLEPRPLPLDVKVVLLVDRFLHVLLKKLDKETADLFKVTADFNERVERDEAQENSFARLLGDVARTHGARPLDRGAVARIIDESARHMGDAHKLSTSRRAVEDLVLQADHFCGARRGEIIGAEDVVEAVEMRRRRSQRVQQRIYEAIIEEMLLVDTNGEHIGQVNGLSVHQLSDSAFGAPARITATVRVGNGEVVDIEREAKLGGALHSKGVLILSSYFASRFAHVFPLSLRASIVFEQSYAGVDGDSASLAELLALLSALAGAPVKQSLAVTGSVNQLGVVQPVGGVNEKIEGFFDVCARRGLDGQGVIIPAPNRRHLMLKEEVVDACRRGLFSVYAVERVEEAIELVTGVEAGKENDAGEYPEGSVNARVQKRLHSFAMVAAKFAKLSQRVVGGSETSDDS